MSSASTTNDNINCDNIDSIMGALSITDKTTPYPTPITVYKLEKGYALNKHVVLKNPHRQYNLKPVHFVTINYHEDVGCLLYAVFDIEDTRKKQALALDKLNEHLPKGIIDNIAFKLGCTKFKSKYESADFPFNFVQKYKGTMPTYLTLVQIKKLYELGVIKIGFGNQNSINTMTDDAFDYVYPNNGINRVRQLFGTKEKMYEFIKRIYLKRF